MTLSELAEFDGKNGRKAYIAYQGTVYDVTESALWKSGSHMVIHHAGRDLSAELAEAPHGEEVFGKFPVVGQLESEAKKPPQTPAAAPPPVTATALPVKERLRRWYAKYHPHPMLVHFPIALHFFAGGFDLAFFATGAERYELMTFYAFLFATLFGALAMVPGILSWWVNYDLAPIKALLIKLYVSLFALLIGTVALMLRYADAQVAYGADAAALVYHFAVLITVPAVVVLGYYGGLLTWGKCADKPAAKAPAQTKAEDFTILIGGPAGAGVESAEELLTAALKSSGLHLFATKEFMSRVRGGVNTLQIRLANRPVCAPNWKVDLFVALDEKAFDHARDRLHENTLRHNAAQSGTQKRYLNTYAAGLVYGVLGLEPAPLIAAVNARFGDKNPEENQKALQAGLAAGRANAIATPPQPGHAPAKYSDGTTAIGYGFLAGGCNFVASYPMSPSTGVLTFMAGASKTHTVLVEQAEDEIAALNMALGAWYAGGRGLTTTSGGGFALMTEAVSLSGMTETPAVIYLAQRPGPATGLPTRTEQGDLNLAIHAGHGFFPKIVLAPGDLDECVKLGAAAFDLADRFQCPVIVLSDQYLADSVQAISPVNFSALAPKSHTVQSGADYRRYALTPNGISPRAVPGQGEGLVCADSDEHDERGQITERYEVRDAMVEKRRKKMALIVQNALPPLVSGRGEIALIGWGSTKAVIAEAIARLGDKRLTQAHFMWVHPLSDAQLEPLRRTRNIVIENNVEGQFADRLRSCGIPVEKTLLQSNGFPFFIDELILRLKEIL